ncbi:hypothetical protein [Nesterenkonia pannonica]|uniref:hypothetical protein n=1 Tax=Nesterenkonia pannonica TaxID=1548602 RepID=UPI0021646568|nr:hypothetical protein [Nesterenkonia pannonica]
MQQLTPATTTSASAPTPAERTAPLVVLTGGARSRSLVYSQPQAHQYPDRYLMVDAEAGDGPDEAAAVIHLESHGVLESFPLPGGRRRFVAWDAPGSSAEPAAQAERMAQLLSGHRAAADPEQVRAFGVRRFVAPACATA